jgi:hypothetical protein
MRKIALSIAIVVVLVLAYNAICGDIFARKQEPATPTNTTAGLCLLPTNPDSIINAQTIRSRKINTTFTRNGYAGVPANTFYLAVDWGQQDEDSTVIYMYAYNSAGDSSCIDTTYVTPTASTFSFVTLTPCAYSEWIRIVMGAVGPASADTNIYKNAYLDMRIQ